MSDDYETRLREGLEALTRAVPVGSRVRGQRTIVRGQVHARRSNYSPALLLVGAVLVAAALVGSSLLANRANLDFAVGTGASQVAPASGTSATTATVNDTSRYGDGIPLQFAGLPVLRGQAAAEKAVTSTDASPFLIGFWVGPELPQFCGQIGPNDAGSYSCGALTNVGDKPGIRSPSLGQALRMDTGNLPIGPVVERVHTHDPAFANCTSTDRLACEHLMVGEATLWTGDSFTAPSPVTVSAAAAAFHTNPNPSMLTCIAQNVPGAVPLAYPNPGNGASQEAAILVFPSVASLIEAVPSVATSGESEIGPAGHPDCAHAGTDASRGAGLFTFRVRWMAKANVLVGVQYDVALGVDRDPVVRAVRGDLATLGAGTSPTK
jgi:hypothetical protein